MYDERLKAGGGVTFFNRGPPKTSFMVVLLLILLVTNYAHFKYLESRYRAGYEKEARALQARRKDTPEVMRELAIDYRMDSRLALAKETWLPNLIFSVLPSLPSKISSLSQESSSSSSSSRPSSPTSSLTIEAVRYCLVLFLVYLAWSSLCLLTGSSSPVVVVRDSDMSRGGFERGDVLLVKWGRPAQEDLACGQVLLYRQMEDDAQMALSRVHTVHKEGNAQGKRVVGGDIWIMTKRDNATRDDRKLRLQNTGDQFFAGRDDSYPGRVFYKIPYIGLLPLAFGEPIVLVYLAALAYTLYALIKAGQIAKKSRLGPSKPFAKKTVKTQ